MNRTHVVIAASSGALIALAVGFILGAEPSSTAAPGAASAGVATGASTTATDGATLLPEPVWGEKRLRYCSIVELAKVPERAGQGVTVEYEFRQSAGMSVRTWRFVDAGGALTLTAPGSGCLSSSTNKLEPGKYRFQFNLPELTVAVSPEANAAVLADPRVAACEGQFPDPRGSSAEVAVVIDHDGTTWASDGTTDNGTIAHCVAEAAKVVVDEQLAAGTLGLTGPAAVLLTIPATGPAPVPTPGALLKPRK